MKVYILVDTDPGDILYSVVGTYSTLEKAVQAGIDFAKAGFDDAPEDLVALPLVHDAPWAWVIGMESEQVELSPLCIYESELELTNEVVIE